MREGSVDGLEEVEARGGTVLGEFGAGCIKGGRRLVEEGMRGVIMGDVKTGFGGVGGVGSQVHRRRTL